MTITTSRGKEIMVCCIKFQVVAPSKPIIAGAAPCPKACNQRLLIAQY